MQCSLCYVSLLYEWLPFICDRKLIQHCNSETGSQYSNLRLYTMSFVLCKALMMFIHVQTLSLYGYSSSSSSYCYSYSMLAFQSENVSHCLKTSDRVTTLLLISYRWLFLCILFSRGIWVTNVPIFSFLVHSHEPVHWIRVIQQWLQGKRPTLCLSFWK